MKKKVPIKGRICFDLQGSMDYKEVHPSDQDGRDGIWFMDCGLGMELFHDLFKTQIYVVHGLDTKFDGVGFRSIFENKKVPYYFFTNLRNHKQERLGYEVACDGGRRADHRAIAKWYDNEPMFYSDVFVKLWKKDVVQEVTKEAWADHWKFLVLLNGVRVLRSSKVMKRHWFAHKSDIDHIQVNLLGASFNNNEDGFIKLIGPSLNDYIDATYSGEEVNPKRICSFCGWYDGSRIKQCPCKIGVRYCSPKCQSVHWRMVHKKECAWKIK